MAGKGTPAIVVAEHAGIVFTVHEYVHHPKATSYGLEAAEKLGLDPAHVFKTLVADVDGTLTVAIVPVGAQLDLKALGKRVTMADVRSWPSARRATSPAGSARSGSASGCRPSSTSRRSHTRRFTSARVGAGSRSS